MNEKITYIVNKIMQQEKEHLLSGKSLSNYDDDLAAKMTWYLNLEAHEPFAEAACIAQDPVTGDDLFDGLVAYRHREFVWTNEDTFAIQRYRIPVDPRFLSFVNDRSEEELLEEIAAAQEEDLSDDCEDLSQ